MADLGSYNVTLRCVACQEVHATEFFVIVTESLGPAPAGVPMVRAESPDEGGLPVATFPMVRCEGCGGNDFHMLFAPVRH